MKQFLLAVIMLVFTGSSMAEDICGQAKSRFEGAVDSYKKGGSKAFVAALLKDGPLEGDARSMSQAQNLSQIEDFFGSVESASILSTKILGAKACYIIGILEYQDGPAFAVINYYKGSKGIGATSMFFKTEPEQILPTEFLVQ